MTGSLSQRVSPGEAGLVSAIIPTYNGGRFLAQAIESVQAQTYRPVELIVVDDGSQDDSAAIAQRYAQVRLFRQANQGVATARNRGVVESRGEFIAFLDQDDRWTPDKLAIQVKHLQENPALGYVLALQRVVLDPGVPPPAWLREKHLETDPTGYLPGTLVVRRSCFFRVGEFEPSLKAASDSEWFFRANGLGVPMAVLPQVLLLRGIHDANQSRDVRTSQEELLTTVRMSLLKRRRAGGTNP